jgi:hypothetical protein
VSLKPDWRRCAQDRRFDRYRNRVARLFRGDKQVGLVLVTAVPYAEVESGHLWWRRWSTPYELLWTYTIVDDTIDDAPIPVPAQDEELDDYATGRYKFRGETLRAEWVSAGESARLRETHFSEAR